MLFDHARQLSLTDQVRYALQVALGMKYLHSKHVMHRFVRGAAGWWLLQRRDACALHDRDLKPENLLVNARGDLQIADLGLARSINSNSQTSLANSFGTGTATYMAPYVWPACIELACKTHAHGPLCQ